MRIFTHRRYALVTEKIVFSPLTQDEQLDAGERFPNPENVNR